MRSNLGCPIFGARLLRPRYSVVKYRAGGTGVAACSERSYFTGGAWSGGGVGRRKACKWLSAGEKEKLRFRDCSGASRPEGNSANQRIFFGRLALSAALLMASSAGLGGQFPTPLSQSQAIIRPVEISPRMVALKNRVASGESRCRGRVLEGGHSHRHAHH